MPSAAPPGGARRSTLVCCAGLAALTVATFARIVGHDFVSFDDQVYITANPHVLRGLAPAGVAWAFTTLHEGIWHPLAWITHMIDVSVFGTRAGGHHGVNLALHAANTLLLFLVLQRATGKTGRAVFVAALFGVHPLHVESVAWATERKDVLYALFWFLALLAYQRYAERPGAARYAAVAGCFAASVLSKPMAVTLPFVLLLWDAWPLGRLRLDRERPWSALRPLLLEKLPLFAASAAAVVVGIVAAGQKGAVRDLSESPLAGRIANALVSGAAYIGQMAWPADLAVYYPFVRQIPAWQIASAALVLAACTVFALRARGAALTGWLWYLGTLAPVIGLLQVGGYARADRYTYVPLVGVFVMIAWGAAAAIERLPEGRRAAAARALSAVGVLVVLVCAVLAFRQAGTWRNSTTLFRQAVAATDDNWFAHTWYGAALLGDGDLAGAEAQLRRALEIYPPNATARLFLGTVLLRVGRPADAEPELRAALAQDPAWTQAHEAQALLGEALASMQRHAEAADALRAAIARRPDYGPARLNLGALLIMGDDLAGAERELLEAARLMPDQASPRCNLSIVHMYRQDYAAAWKDVDACRQLGGTPPPHLEDDLARVAPRGAR